MDYGEKGECASMTKFIENVNLYLSQMKIKQTYVSFKSGINEKKLSRILTGIQDVNSRDMEKIADALGQNTGFFLSDSFSVPAVSDFMREKIAFYAGEPTAEQEETAEKLFQLMENIDEVMSAKSRFLNMSGSSR